jgi:hypothetical protein
MKTSRALFVHLPWPARRGRLQLALRVLAGRVSGTYLNTTKPTVDEMIENIRNRSLSLGQQRRQLDLLAALNNRHRETREEDAALEARIQSFELAYRMQLEATDAFDVSREPARVLEMYGPGVQARSS